MALLQYWDMAFTSGDSLVATRSMKHISPLTILESVLMEDAFMIVFIEVFDYGFAALFLTPNYLSCEPLPSFQADFAGVYALERKTLERRKENKCLKSHVYHAKPRKSNIIKKQTRRCVKIQWQPPNSSIEKCQGKGHCNVPEPYPHAELYFTGFQFHFYIT